MREWLPTFGSRAKSSGFNGKRGLRLTRVRGVPFASEALNFDQPPDRFRVAGILGGLLQTTNSLISDTDHRFEHLALMSHVALGGFHEFQN